MIKRLSHKTYLVAFSISILLFWNAACVSNKPLSIDEEKSPIQLVELFGVIGDYFSIDQIMDSKGTIHTVFLGQRQKGACMLDVQVPYKMPDKIAVYRLDECDAIAVSEIATTANTSGGLSIAWIAQKKNKRELTIQKYSSASDWMSPATVPLQGKTDNLAMSLDADGNLLTVWRVREGRGFYAAYCDDGGKCQSVPGLRLPDTVDVIHTELVTAGDGNFMLLWEQNDEKGNFTILSGYFSATQGFNTDPVVVGEGQGNFSGTWMAQASTPERIVVAWAARNIYAREFVRGSGWKPIHKVKEMYSPPNYVSLGTAGDDVVITWKDGGEGALRAITSKKIGLWDRETYLGDEHEDYSLMWPRMLSGHSDSLFLFWIEKGREIWGNRYISGKGWGGVKQVNQEDYSSLSWYNALGNGTKSALLPFPITQDGSKGIVKIASKSKIAANFVTAREYSTVTFAIQYME